MRKTLQVIGLIFGSLLVGVSPTWAVDGVVLIDQNKAMAGNVTPGDAPGFPVTISLPGSYQLAGNLTVPNENTIAIQINANNVTLNLNGFSILGPTVCNDDFGNPLTCTPSGSGIGVYAPSNSVSVFNGNIQGMGATGLVFYGSSARVENLHVTSNAGGGIFVEDFNGGFFPTANVNGNTVFKNGGDGINVVGGNVTGNTAIRNGGAGITAVGTVRGNSASKNRLAGFYVPSGIVTGNSSTYNSGAGMNLQSGLSLEGTGYSQNVVSYNNGGTVIGGVSLGQNLCNGSVC